MRGTVRSSLLAKLAAGGVVTLVALAACSPGTGGGGVDGGTACSPPNFELPACQACIMQQCQASATTACNQGNAFVDCYCPCTAPANSNKEECAASCATSSCQDAAASCLATVLGPGGQCVTACGSSDADAGSGGDGGSGDAGCSGVTFACYHPPGMAGQGGVCEGTENVPSAALPQLQQLCTGQQGMPMSHCPNDAALVGCCTLSKGCGQSTNCTYTAGTFTPQDQAALQMMCLQANMGDAGVVATFSTTPP